MTVIINGTTGISGVDGSAGTPAVQGSDTNTGVFYPAADTVGVSTGGSERMRVDSSGNVGIGTTAPTQKLELNSGFVKVGNGVGGGGGVWFPYSGDAAGRTWRTRTDIVGYGDFGFEQSTTQTGTTFATKMLIDANGNVGIGTTTPSAKLNVISGSVAQLIIGFNGTSASYLDSDSVVFRNAATSETGRFTSTGVFQFNSGYGSSAAAYGCRAWVNFNGTGTVAIRGSANVSSITDVATGQYAVNFSTTIVDANYCTNVTGTHQSGVYVAWGAISNATPPTTSAVRVDFNANGGALTDVQFAQVSIMR